MSKAFYIGVNGKARKVKSLYIGVSGKARRVKKAYIGVNGKARLFYVFDDTGAVNIDTSVTVDVGPRTNVSYGRAKDYLYAVGGWYNYAASSYGEKFNSNLTRTSSHGLVFTAYEVAAAGDETTESAVFAGGRVTDTTNSNVVTRLKAGTNSSFTALNEKLCGIAAAAFEDSAWFGGGKSDGGGYSGTIYKYVISTGTLNTSRSMSATAYGAAATVTGATDVYSYIVFIPGQNSTGVYVNYDGAAWNKYHGSAVTLSTPKSAAATYISGTSFNGYACFFGGLNSLLANSDSSSISDAYYYDSNLTKSNFSQKFSMYGATAVSVGKYLLVGGGYRKVSNTHYSNSGVRCYNTPV